MTYFTCLTSKGGVIDLKEFTLKLTFAENVTHPQAVRDVDELVFSSEQIWRNLALHHLLTNGSSTMNGCRQNESQRADKKHHNNPQVIHKIPVHKLMPCEVKSCMFVINKCIIKMF